MGKKERHVLRKNWSYLRADIATKKKELTIADDEFHPIMEWQIVEDKIEEYFLYKRSNSVKRSWLWNDLKSESYAVRCSRDPYNKLSLLVDEKELVYFLVSETINELTKYWYYEGRIESIMLILGESGINEYYLVSKKYKWLLCYNHHDVLIGCGNIIPLLKKLEISLDEAI